MAQQAKMARQEAGKLKAVDFKGKRYVMVHSKLNALRGVGEDGIVWENGKGKDWGIENNIIEFDENHAVIQCRITDETGRLRSTGEAVEYRDDKNSFVNKTSFLENCATSAMGRALAALGIGTEDSFASADELAVAISQQSGGSKAAPKEELSENWLNYYLTEMGKCQNPNEANELLSRFMLMANDVDYTKKNLAGEAQAPSLNWSEAVNLPFSAIGAVMTAYQVVISRFAASRDFMFQVKHLMDKGESQMVCALFVEDLFVDVEELKPKSIPLITEHRARMYPFLKDYLEKKDVDPQISSCVLFHFENSSASAEEAADEEVIN